MAIGPPPELDVARVQRWCADRVPSRLRDQLHIECEVAGRDITIVERRPPWGADEPQEWARSPVARLRYVKSRGIWRLYWRDSDENWREYSNLRWAPTVHELLNELDRDPTALFWG